MGQYFKQLCQWLDLEAGSELYTVAELRAKVVEFLVNVRQCIQSKG